MKFRADPPSAFRIVPLDSLTALYHRRSGQTHLVGEPVPEILAALGANDADLVELLARLGLMRTEDNEAAVTARLDEMIAAGLVSAS